MVAAGVWLAPRRRYCGLVIPPVRHPANPRGSRAASCKLLPSNYKRTHLPSKETSSFFLSPLLSAYKPLDRQLSKKKPERGTHNSFTMSSSSPRLLDQSCCNKMTTSEKGRRKEIVEQTYCSRMITSDKQTNKNTNSDDETETTNIQTNTQFAAACTNKCSICIKQLLLLHYLQSCENKMITSKMFVCL